MTMHVNLQRQGLAFQVKAESIEYSIVDGEKKRKNAKSDVQLISYTVICKLKFSIHPARKRRERENKKEEGDRKPG